MLRWYKRDLCGGRRPRRPSGGRGARRHTLPPVELCRDDAVTPHERAVAERREDPRPLEALERGDVEVIVVIVADQHEVDRRKVFEANAGRAVAVRAGERDGRCAVRPDRISKNVDAVELDERRRVIDECDAQLAVADAPGRRRTGRGVDPLTPVAALAVEHPLDERAVALSGGLKIVKAFAVKMIGNRAAVTRRGDESPLDCRSGCGRASSDGNPFCGPAHPIYPKRPAGEIARGSDSLTTIP